MALCIGIAGGTGSGKSALAQRLGEHFPERSVIIECDWYYRDLRHLAFQKRLQTNFDHPEALELDLLFDHVQRLLHGLPVQVPQYDFTQHIRCEKTRCVEPRELIIVEGIHALTDERLRGLYALRIYLDVPADIRLARRIQRDILTRGRSVESIVGQYLRHVRPMHEQFVEPCKAYADIVLAGEQFSARDVADLVQRLRRSLG